MLYRPDGFEPPTVISPPPETIAEWRPVLEGKVAESAKATAREVGRRLRGSDVPGEANAAVWSPTELARGHPGLAVTFAQLERGFPGEGWSDAAHAQMALAVAALRREPDAPTGLLSGLAGLGLAADLVDAEKYQKLLATLDGLIRRRTEAIVRRIDARARGVAEEDIDLVFGLSGIGGYFLARGDEDSLRPILDRLVRLIRAGGPIPAWHTPPALLNDEAAAAYPGGRLNLGLAHGLPGPLALLALASSAGVESADLAEAIERASSWLADHAVHDQWGVNWPAFLAAGAAGSERPPTRAGWCYGAPGIARALWLAGVAVQDSRLRRLALAALEAVHRRPPDVLRVDAPTFCHGLAGLLQITLRMANDSGRPELRVAGRELAVRLLDRFEADSVLGYRDLDPDGRAVDQAGVLQGAAGTALVLLATAAPVAPRWDRALLLS